VITHDCEEHRRIIRNIRSMLITPEAGSVQHRMYSVLMEVQSFAEQAMAIERKLNRIPLFVRVFIGLVYDTKFLCERILKLSKELHLTS
jgi:hypothetical protein